MVTAQVLFAHAGGWDEALFVLLPIGLFAGLLALANRRATADAAREGARSADADADADDLPADGPPGPPRPNETG